MPGGPKAEAGPFMSDAIKRAASILAGLEHAAVRFHQLVDGGPDRMRAVPLRRTDVEPTAGCHLDLKEKYHRNWVVPTKLASKPRLARAGSRPVIRFSSIIPVCLELPGASS